MGRAHRMRAVLVGFGGASLRLQIMTGVALAATVALVLAVFWADREPPAGTEPGEVLRVGVVEGQSVGGYLAASRDELARLTDPSAPAAGDTWALVAFRRYAAPGGLPDLLSGAQVAQVYTRVPLTGSRTGVNRIPVYRLPDDVTAGMISAAVSRERERADYQRLGRALTGDGRNEMRLRAAYESAARIAAEEAAAYRAGCACVFAAVVRGTPAALDGIADRPGVRVVDPAPEVRGLDRTEFRPPRPEELETAPADPSPSAVPSGNPGVAPDTVGPLPSSIGVPVTSTSPESSGRTPFAAVLPTKDPVAVPSASDASPAHDGPDASPGASTGDSGR
ncbi:hypothetical protein Aca07nite_81640 [Actinoplanes capillaceus]|uniref:Uncharacterized protein n=1 Tax=Actinoplanes campanulatus TaxID=113559 RepID=A0ABQ3WX80_9ACTN|nr:hypothetical protein [Actinoplanes capillaceus]GID50889.1 hypothetical protein Aca07nite_81640 [Actinoplanes capillaceus]